MRQRSEVRRPSRLRTAVLLGSLLLLPTACTLAAPGAPSDEDRVTILGPWTEDQETRFTDLLDGFGIPYAYQGTAAQREVLLSQVQAGTAPDVAIMPGVGELADYAANDQLKSLKWLGRADLEQYDAPFLPRTDANDIHWVPVKADLKSIVWHRKGQRPPQGPPPAAAWCMGMGDDGASGWPGSDWIEDIVLQSQGPAVYQEWVTGRRPWTDSKIVAAWRAWGAMMAKDAKAAEAALLTDHRGSPSKTGGGLLFRAGACTLEHQGSFASALYGPQAARAQFTDSARLLPGGPYPQLGYEVSADFAVLFNDTPQARALLAKLVSREGQQSWMRDGTMFSARSDIVPGSAGADNGHSGIARRLTGRPPKAKERDSDHGAKAVRCLDASDVMSPAVRDAFYDAVLLYLSEPGKDPTPRLEGIQKVQEAEREDDAQGARAVGLSGVCSASHQVPL